MSTPLMTVPITDAGYLKAFAPEQLYASATLSLKSHGYGFGDESQTQSWKSRGFCLPDHVRERGLRQFWYPPPSACREQIRTELIGRTLI